MKYLKQFIQFLMKFFTTKPLPTTTEDSASGSELLKEYTKIGEDMTYLESQYETFILKSLDRDFDLVKDDIVAIKKSLGGYSSKGTPLWAPEDIDSNSMKMMKCGKGYYGSSDSNCLKIKFKHNNLLSLSSFEISDLSLLINGKSIKVNKRNFKNMLFKYFMAYHIGLSKQTLNESKTSFDSMMSILGADVYRDSKIDDILQGS